VLNPFAFPVETEGRFNLFIAVALSLAGMTGFTVTVLLAGYGLINPPYEFGGMLPADPMDFPAQRAAFIRLIADTLPWLAIPAGLSLTVLFLAGVIFLLHPAYLRWRKKLQPFPEGRDAQFLAALDALVAQAGLPSRPSLEIGGAVGTADGQAFGVGGRYALRFGSRMRLLLRKAPDRFAAIVLHELAHIANRDVRRTYFSLAAWIALFISALLPLLFLDILHVCLRFIQTAFGLGGYTWTYFFTAVIPRALLLGIQVGLLLLVATAVLSGILRVREHYADWKAALWGAGETLAEILASKEPSTSRVRRWWRWSLHPSATERLAVLQAPLHLFQMSRDLPFFAGFLLAFLLGGLVQIGPLLMLVVRGATQLLYLRIVQWLLPSGSPLAASFLSLATDLSLVVPLLFAVLLFLLGMGYLIAGTVGIQVQREALASLASGREPRGSYRRLWLPALLLAGGLQFGFMVTPSSPLAPLHYSLRSFFLLVGLAPFWIAGFSILVWLWMAYARFSSLHLLGTYPGDRPPRWRGRGLLIVLSLLMWVLLTPGLLLQLILRDLAQDPAFQTLPWVLFPILLIASLGLFLLASALTWLWGRYRNRVALLCCPACGGSTDHLFAAGRVCEGCGMPLAGWLLVR
jgi:Zn-dependent protease with chaperone function